MTKQDEKIVIYTDGSCLGNPGYGGFAAILIYGSSKKIVKGSKKNSTSNRMELQAVISALLALKPEAKNLQIEIFLDSKYVKQGITEWIHVWKLNDWKTKQNKQVKNLELWKKLDKISNNYNITWQWVKGHANNDINNEVDMIARNEASLEKNKSQTLNT